MSNIFMHIKNGNLFINVDEPIISKRFFKKKMNLFSKFDDNTYVKSSPKYYELEDLIKYFLDKSETYNYKLHVDESVKEYIEFKSLRINELSKIGQNIKNQGVDEIEFHKFTEIIEENVERNLYPLQMEMAYHMYKVKRTMNFSVPGTGKTAMVLGLYAFLNSDYNSDEYCDKIIVFCTKNAFKSWVDEFKETFGSKRELICFTPDTTKDSKYEIAVKYQKYNLILVNYEKIGSYETALDNAITSNALVVFDEIHRIKSSTGKRAMDAKEYVKTNGHLIALTGTPIPNGYEDIKNMLEILFQDDYDLMDFSKYNLNALTSRETKNIGATLDPFFLRVTKDMLRIPPPEEDIIHDVYINREEKDALRIVANKDLTFFAKFVRLNQVLSAPSKFGSFNDYTFDLDFGDDQLSNEIKSSLINNEFLDSEISKINQIGISSKMSYTIELITKLVSEGKNVIVWCLYTDTINVMKNLLSNYSITVEDITGKTFLEDRELIIDKFNSNKINVLITNPKTLAESVSLHKLCHDAIYFELDYDLAKFLQSKDRIHRLGLKNNQYTQYHFITSRINDGYSLENEVLKALEKKENVMKEFFESDTYIYNFSNLNSDIHIDDIILDFHNQIN